MLPLPPTLNVAELKLLKARARFALAWGVIVLFIMLGALSGHKDLSVYFAIITSLMWVLFRIIREGLDALMFLKATKQADEETKSDDD